MEFRFKFNQEKALRALQGAPKELGRSFSLALKASARDIQAGAIQDHRFTSRSGNADRSVQSNVTGLKGRVFLDTGIAPYSPFLHEGTGVFGPDGQAFTIKPKAGKSLRFVKGGKFRFAKSVIQLGIKGDPYLYRAGNREMVNIGKRLDRAINRVIKDQGL